jgi:Flp pilus assembly protein TadG
MMTNYKIFKKNQLPGLQKGVAAVEFGLLIILLMMIVGAIIEFGRVFWFYDALTKATRDGARLMSRADKSIIASTEVATARSLVVAAANSARVSPGLTTGNVRVECLNASYSVIACIDGTAPENVRVSIINFDVVIGGLMPLFVATGGLADYDAVALAPHTTMRYLR